MWIKKNKQGRWVWEGCEKGWYHFLFLSYSVSLPFSFSHTFSSIICRHSMRGGGEDLPRVHYYLNLWFHRLYPHADVFHFVRKPPINIWGYRSRSTPCVPHSAALVSIRSLVNGRLPYLLEWDRPPIPRYLRPAAPDRWRSRERRWVHHWWWERWSMESRKHLQKDTKYYTEC